MFLKKILIILFLGAGLFIFSCEDTFDLDINDDPNFPTPENANIDALYASVQVNFAQFLNGSGPNVTNLNDFGMQLSRQRAFTFGNVYANSYQPTTFDDIWRQAYSDFLPDADEIIKQAEERGLPFQGGTTKILKAYVLMTLVDAFGDVPFTEANQGADFLSPRVDSGASIYAAAEALIDEGIADLGAETISEPLSDNFFNGDVNEWINAAKSLKIKLYVTTKLVDSGAGAKMMAIVNDPDYVPSNFYFQYTSNRANPDSRHPFYQDSYETVEGDYQSNWMMWVMSKEKGISDPRIRSYYYRQVPEVPLDDVNRFDCVFSPLPTGPTPQHYLDCDPNMPYCVGNLEEGYYGRDHGNNGGIPPDGDIRTVYGVYPAGGKFDANTFNDILNDGTDGGLGAGIQPLIPANFIKFYRAEAALTMGTGEDARTLLGEAVRESIDNVLAFTAETDPASLEEVVGTNPNTGESIFGSQLVPVDSTIVEYVDEVLSIYDAANDKLDVVMKEFLIASFGNGMEGYNMLRRTGRPFNVQPMIQPTSGSFIRSALYPAVYSTLNEFAVDKSETTQVFWDTNPADFIK